MMNDGNDGNNNSFRSLPAAPNSERLLPPRGDYRTLLSFQKAEIVYYITFRFAHKFLSKGDRTIDQMIQSAHSGNKNILECSKAALTSRETEIKLTNVARSSLEELRDDYKDYLRTRTSPSGTRIPERRALSANWAARHRTPTKTIRSLWKPGPQKSWPISPSASFIRPII